MNIVYILLNTTNLYKDTDEPILYIGSKTSCKVVDDIIIDKNNKPYWSSSRYVSESIECGDFWELLDWFDVGCIDKVTDIEAKHQILVNAKTNHLYYNKSHANGKFCSTLDGVGDAISKSKIGIVTDRMKEYSYYSRLHTKDAIAKSAEARRGNPRVSDAAKKRNARLAQCPEWTKARSERVSKQFTGRKLTEHEIYLRMHDDRFKPNRKMTNIDVWNIRYGKHSYRTLIELCDIYPCVSKATLSRVMNFKVFKDIDYEWRHEK